MDIYINIDKQEVRVGKDTLSYSEVKLLSKENDCFNERIIPAYEKYCEFRREFIELIKSGMFWVMFPNFTGTWKLDKDLFIDFKLRNHGME